MKTVSETPTINDPLGIYKLVSNGLYFGHFQVGKNWCGEKYVRKVNSIEAESLESREYECSIDIAGF